MNRFHFPIFLNFLIKYFSYKSFINPIKEKVKNEEKLTKKGMSIIDHFTIIKNNVIIKTNKIQ